MLLIGTTTVALADWKPGDGHKMHWPQLPDPNGWDVDFGWWALGDDWECSETGPVEDIHFWISWYYDEVVDPIPWINVSIWSNNPSGPHGWSEPLQMLWTRIFYPGQFIIKGPEYGDQGWLIPPYMEFYPNNHQMYFQVNIPQIYAPFEQVADEIYWLVIQMPFNSEWIVGWKTTLIDLQFQDFAVWSAEPGYEWWEIPGFDLAFVITGGTPPVPDLDCRGSLTWEYPGGSQPGGTKTGTFQVGNIGQPGSLLDWSVTAWPPWGTWTFTPSSGTGVAQGSWVTVTASVVPPSQPYQHFTGFITVTNTADATDFCQIPVSLDTPRARDRKSVV